MSSSAPSPAPRPGRPAWLNAATLSFVGVVVFFAAATPLAMAVDSRVDRTRPMYHDREAMAWLQYQSVVITGQAVPLELSGAESVELAGEEFTPSEGVTVEVSAEDPVRPCVRASNEHGDVTEWSCLDLEDPPVDPDPEDPDLGVS